MFTIPALSRLVFLVFALGFIVNPAMAQQKTPAIPKRAIPKIDYSQFKAVTFAPCDRNRDGQVSFWERITCPRSDLTKFKPVPGATPSGESGGGTSETGTSGGSTTSCAPDGYGSPVTLYEFPDTDYYSSHDSIFADSEGNIHFFDSVALQIASPSGSISSDPTQPPETVVPYFGLPIEGDGDSIYFSRGSNIYRISSDGALDTVVASLSSIYAFAGATEIAVKGDYLYFNREYVSSDTTVMGEIRKVALSSITGGTIAVADTTTVISGDGLVVNSESGFAVDSEGNVYYASLAEGHHIMRISSTGTISSIFGGGDETASTVGASYPATSIHYGGFGDIDFDSCGNLIIADRNRRVIYLLPYGSSDVTVLFTGGGYAGAPMSVDVGADNTIYVMMGYYAGWPPYRLVKLAPN